MIFGCVGGHIGFKKNANGRHFAHPLKNIVLGLYKLESIDKKMLSLAQISTKLWSF